MSFGTGILFRFPFRAAPKVNISNNVVRSLLQGSLVISGRTVTCGRSGIPLFLAEKSRKYKGRLYVIYPLAREEDGRIKAYKMSVLEGLQN